jgi:hypothetical protein
LRGLAGSSAAKIQTFFHLASTSTKYFYLIPKISKVMHFNFLQYYLTEVAALKERMGEE